MTLRWERRPSVQREYLELLPTKDVRDSCQLLRVVPAQVEGGVLVDQVGQTVRTLLLVCLHPGPLALFAD